MSIVFIGPHTCNMPFAYNITSVGKELPGFSTRILNPDDDGNGEVIERLIIDLDTYTNIGAELSCLQCNLYIFSTQYSEVSAITGITAYTVYFSNIVFFLNFAS